MLPVVENHSLGVRWSTVVSWRTMLAITSSISPGVVPGPLWLDSDDGNNKKTHRASAVGDDDDDDHDKQGGQRDPRQIHGCET